MQRHLRQLTRFSRAYSTIQKPSVLNWKSISAVALAGGALFYFADRETRKPIEAPAPVKIGGPFKLINHFGETVDEKILKGKFSLIYFGFTGCPDICPEELEKIENIVNHLKIKGHDLQAFFISCDPNRDTPEALKQYLSEFGGSVIGLTGSYEDVKAVCKAYKVYFSTPKDTKPGDDYIVDHSTFIYLMNPNGDFQDSIGRNLTALQSISKIQQSML